MLFYEVFKNIEQPLEAYILSILYAQYVSFFCIKRIANLNFMVLISLSFHDSFGI